MWRLQFTVSGSKCYIHIYSCMFRERLSCQSGLREPSPNGCIQGCKPIVKADVVDDRRERGALYRLNLTFGLTGHFSPGQGEAEQLPSPIMNSLHGDGLVFGINIRCHIAFWAAEFHELAMHVPGGPKGNK